MNDEPLDRINALLTDDRERRTGAEGSPALAPPAPAEVFEDEYQKIGWWKGPHATPEARTLVRDFWRSSGEEGVRWLVRRLRDEFHLETFHAVASLLADLGEVILGPVLEELARGAGGDQPLCLLWALDSLSESAPNLRLEGVQAELVLADLLQDDDPDLREEAAQAMRLLSPERAVRWLEHRLRDETNAEVRQTIERELTRHRAGRS
jgi:hypothetical protein